MYKAANKLILILVLIPDAVTLDGAAYDGGGASAVGLRGLVICCRGGRFASSYLC